MYYYNNELPPQQGWICPKCGRANAPWMPTCGCVSSQTSGSGTSYLVKTSSISQDSHEIADTPQTEQKCSNCKFLTYRWNKVWRDIKCDNPHDKVCDRWAEKVEQTDCSWK